jgi:hypothetical protein
VTKPQQLSCKRLGLARWLQRLQEIHGALRVRRRREDRPLVRL